MSTPAPDVAPAPPAPATAPSTTIVAAAATPPLVRCDNCGALVTGRYCGACGQRLEPPVHSLWHFAKVATEDLTHADSRVWRTLRALLLRPGRLTDDFLAGRRVRYLPPVRLYLVVSVIFFLWAAAGEPRSAYTIDLDPGAAGAPAASPAAPAASRAPSSPAGTPATTAETQCRGLTYHGPFARRMQPLSMNACRKIAADNGSALQAALVHNVPRAMFVFLPLLAAGMKLMYWAPRHYYVEHLLLLVHYHAFVFLLLPLAWVLAVLLPAGVVPFLYLAVGLYIPWYLYRSMRVVYGQGRMLTLGKLMMLSVFYLVSGVFMLVLTSLYSALTL